MKDLQNIIGLLVVALTICGGIYHMTYWDVFDINGLELISVTDIIRSALYPIASIYGVIFFGLAGGMVLIPSTLFNREKDGNVASAEPYAPHWVYVIFSFVLFGSAVHRVIFSSDPFRWVAAAIVVSILFAIELEMRGVLSEMVKGARFRIFVFQASCYLIFLSFGIAKFKSESIYNNSSFKYVLPGNISLNGVYVTDTLKYLGFTTNLYVFSTLDNQTKYLVNSGSVPNLKLQTK